MRREGSSHEPEIDAIRWVEGILREIESYPISGNTSEATLRLIGRPGSILDVQQQAQIDAKIAGPSQAEDRSLSTLEGTSAASSAKNKRGRPKKIPIPAKPSPDKEEGIVTRSQIGKPGLLGKIGEVQSKAPITKSPVKMVAHQPFFTVEPSLTDCPSMSEHIEPQDTTKTEAEAEGSSPEKGRGGIKWKTRHGKVNFYTALMSQSFMRTSSINTATTEL